MISITEKLLEERVISISGEIDDIMADAVIKQMLYLEAQAPDKDIYLYINSPGGSISAGLAIYDTMQYITCDVVTICMGMAASMASFLLAGGTQGKRFALPNVDIMIHQPLGGISGQASDIVIVSEHITNLRQRINRILAKACGQTLKKIAADSERDHWLTSEEALKYGIIDKVIVNRKENT